MNDVTVSKKELLEILKKNRESHIQIYKDAIEGSRVKYREALEKELKKLDDGKEVKAYINIDQPTNHEEQYDEVIEMLEMSIDEEITLTRHEFQQYVQDKWVTATEKALLRGLALSSSNSAMYQ